MVLEVLLVLDSWFWSSRASPGQIRGSGSAGSGLMFCSVPDEQSFTLRDAEAEVLFSFNLEESLKRAHASPLFKVGTAPESDQNFPINEL